MRTSFNASGHKSYLAKAKHHVVPSKDGDKFSLEFESTLDDGFMEREALFQLQLLDMKNFSAAHKEKVLTRVNIANFEVQPVQLISSFPAPQVCLLELSLCNTNLVATECHLLAKLPSLHQLTELDISCNPLVGLEGIANLICEGSYLWQLESLVAFSCGVTPT